MVVRYHRRQKTTVMYMLSWKNAALKVTPNLYRECMHWCGRNVCVHKNCIYPDANQGPFHHDDIFKSFMYSISTVKQSA